MQTREVPYFSGVTQKYELGISIAENLFCKTPTTQPAFTCSKLTIKTLEQSVKYVQS